MMNLVQKVLKTLKKIIFKLFSKDVLTETKISQIQEPLIRIGTDYGGWFVPENTLNQSSICYCVGAGEDISFDVGLIKIFDCDVFTFDPTPKAIKHVNELKEKLENQKKMSINNSQSEFYELSPHQVGKLHFEPIGLWNCDTILKFYSPQQNEHVSHSIKNLQKSNNYFEAQCKTIKTIMRENNHQKVDLLKLDIEGAEYEVIDFITEHKIPIKILCVEYDEFYHQLDENYLARIKNSVSKLISAGYKMIHTDGSCNYTFMKL